MRIIFDTSRGRMLPLMVITLLGLTAPASALPCLQISPSQAPPTSAHSVRPSDVAVLSAIGLPHTHSSELSRVISRLSELMTLFNPGMPNPLLKQQDMYAPDSSQSRTLAEQAKELSISLRNNQAIDPDQDWKLVLLLVQVDELCVCQDQVSMSVKAAVQQVDLALQELHSQLKRAIVSVAVWDGEYDTGLPHQNRMCPCMENNSEGGLRLLRATLTQILQDSLDGHLVEKQWYSDRDDFTVLLQDSPFITDPSSVSTGRAPSTARASRHTDKLTIEMWANLLQSTSGQNNLEDNDMTITVPCPSEDQPFLRTERNSPSDHHSELSPLLDSITGTELSCEDLSPSNSIPDSVHLLRPGDIKVVAAVGDSLTAGSGIGAKPYNILDVLKQYRGLSWSVGGDENLTTVTTLPNILRHFNPSLTGYSVGMGNETTPHAFLNQAMVGRKSQHMLEQVQSLVARMKNDSRIDFDSDWKVITMFIGGNDMCDHCYNSVHYSTDNYVRHVREALDYLHNKVPRALVNLVEPLHIVPLRLMHTDSSIKCPTWLVKILCPCVILPRESSRALQQLEDLNRAYQRGLNELVESGQYDTHPNFTVVVQPFIREVVVPYLDGRPDRSYFSPDCFHLSQKAQTLMARALWNNMLEPLGIKTDKLDFATGVPLKCPSKTSPFVQTYLNSNYTYEGPTPTPPPVTNWGSDFSCEDLAPSNSVPTSVHTLRPGDIKVVAALGDSSTAGVGAKANNLLEVNTEYKGVSWSIGGDRSLDTVTTLPNILRKFNPSLYGFSKGQGSWQKGFNMAVPGTKAFQVPAQVRTLIDAMKNDKKVNFEKDWKLVTLFVGGGDLCNYCLDQSNLTPQNYSQNLMLSLDLLYNEVPRVMVHVIEVLQIDPLRRVNKKNDLGCALLQRNNCPCVVLPEDNSPELETIVRINQEYQIETELLISGDRYDGREDFTVVIQPFLRNYFIPVSGEGQPDVTFFSVDCFHFSERAHSEMAIGLWNNMLEPVGRKPVSNNFTYDRSKIHCPSEVQPFIFTKVNSLPNTPVPPTTPVPGTTTTTTTSPRPIEPQCPSSIPVWVPVVLGITGLLIGWGVTCLLFFCRKQRIQMKKEEKAVEMKGTGF